MVEKTACGPYHINKRQLTVFMSNMESKRDTVTANFGAVIVNVQTAERIRGREVHFSVPLH